MRDKFGILAQERAEGFSKGFSQASLLGHDDARYEGYCEGYADARRDRRWAGTIGFVAGAATAALTCWLVFT